MIKVDVTDIESISYPEEITKHNAIGLCSEKTCDGAENQYMKIKLHGMDLVIVFCNEHAEKIHEAISSFIRSSFFLIFEPDNFSGLEGFQHWNGKKAFEKLSIVL